MHIQKVFIIALLYFTYNSSFCAQNGDKYFIVLTDSAKIIKDEPMTIEVELVLYSGMKPYSYIRKIELKPLLTDLISFKSNESEITLNGRTYILYIKTQKTFEDFLKE